MRPFAGDEKHRVMMRAKWVVKRLLMNLKLYGHVGYVLRRHVRRRLEPTTGIVELYSRFVRPKDLCFDIGANIGKRSLAMLECGGKVVAVEPQPHCVWILNENYSQWVNRFWLREQNFVCVSKVAGPKAGTATLYVSERHWLSSLQPEWIGKVIPGGSWSSWITVEMVTLDELIAEFGVPRFCKIDVEGSELEVLRGLSQPIPCISFEYHSDMIDECAEVLEYVAGLGVYRFNLSSKESGVLTLGEWIGRDEFRRYLDTVLAKQSDFGDVYALTS